MSVYGHFVALFGKDWSLLFEWEESSEIDYCQDGQKY